MDKQMTFAVLGAGSWGTALALQLSYCGYQVNLWGQNQSAIQEMQQLRCNKQYLPDFPFPELLTPFAALDEALLNVDVILVAVPSHAFESLLIKIKPLLSGQPLLAATKGLLRGRLLHEIVEQVLGEMDYALLSGPSFAKEVAAKLPTTVIISSKNQQFARAMATAFSSDLFRVYTNSDIIGVEVGGAVKNVLAVAVGISDGMGFGANARAALITRGLKELARLGEALGAQADTLQGLSGLGDLILTCTDDQSRNRRFGLAIGRGDSVDVAQESIGQVVESVSTTQEVLQLARKYDVDKPITMQVYQVLHDGLSPEDAVRALFSRDLKSE